MKATVVALSSIFLSLGILLVGHGLQQTLLPLYAQSAGWSPAVIGVTGSAYFFGFIVGCYLVPRFIRDVGHIRVFACCLGLAIVSILMTEKWQVMVAWLLARLCTGACFAGLYMVLESWLNEQAPNESRGSVLSFYGFLALVAMLLGQALVLDANLAEGASLVAIIFALAILPVALTASPQPLAPAETRIGFRVAYEASQVGPVLSGVSGFVMGLIWSNGAVYTNSLHGDAGARFIVATLLGGLVCQLPIGRLSDLVDRRWVLLGLCVVGCFATTAWVVFPTGVAALYALGFVLGGTAMPMYSLAIAHANDNANGSFLAISSAMLLANGLGAAGGPLIYAGLNLSGLNDVYFLSISAAYLLGASWTIYRLAVHDVERPYYEPYQAFTKSTLAAADLDPRSDDSSPQN